MEVYDQDILFNGNGWKAVLETQGKLFDTNALAAISDQLRKEFYNGHVKGRTMPEIEKADWRTNLLDRYGDREIGYDLPCLLSTKRATRGRIMLCAQDPLRNGASPRLTVGTFFGIDNNSYRHNRRHHGAIWNLIRTCANAGYEILVTDALKIFVGKNQLQRNESLTKLSFDILADEIEVFAPDLILAMGRDASNALSRVRPERSFVHATHPAYYGKKGWYLEGSSAPNVDKLKGLEQYYCRRLFGTNSPQDTGDA